MDGVITAAAEKQLIKAVTHAAKAAKTAFGNNAVRNALADMLFPKDASALMELYGGLNDPAFRPEHLGPLFGASSGFALNMKNGPHALVLSVKAPASGTLAQEVYDNALKALRAQNAPMETPAEAIEAAYLEAMTDLAAKYRKKPPAAISFTLDIDALAAAEAA